jgi:hypothetical protein
MHYPEAHIQMAAEFEHQWRGIRAAGEIQGKGTSHD